jgi:ketosteroid isomerase-like protein
MSEENVEVVRRFLDAFGRRDRDAYLALLDPEFEGFPPSEWPESAPVRGREAAWDFGLELEAPWQESVGEITELIEAGNDRTVMGIAGRRAGKASAVDLGKLEVWAVITFRGGRIFRIEWFLDRDEALEAAGLEE